MHFLLAQASPGRWIFCLPFAHLEPFYQSCGFSTLPPLITLPAPILTKQQWCRETYEDPVIAMARKK